MANRVTGSQADGLEFEIGDRVLVSGGHEPNPQWLQGRDGYAGTLVDLAGKWAAVELDDALTLPAGTPTGWHDFGRGSASAHALIPVAHGRWLALSQAWSGWE